eukprot:5730387-Prymnesium_polylepis.1
MCSSRALCIRSISDSVVVSIRRQTAKVGGSPRDPVRIPTGLLPPSQTMENIPALKWGRASGGGHS